MTYCHVCRKEIGTLGWPSHVAMEKRKYGDDIYTMLKALRKEYSEYEYDLAWKSLIEGEIKAKLPAEQKTLEVE